ncbi:MAG: 2-hydroxy-3-oxopropionate reductase [Micromonosporaceae bacterium]
MTETVGFIGLGVMGRPMAENLLAAGVPLVVANRSAAARDVLVERGAVAAGSAAEVAARAGVVVTMLPDDPAVREVVAGQLLPAARPGSLIIDMSTVSPALSRELDELATARGVAMLDAPVSGGDVGARNGTLSIMVGGRAADLDRARPLLSILGGSVVHVGPAGTGQVVKACNQVLVAVTIAGVSEALVLAARHGVAAATVLDVLSAGLAANRVMEVRRDNFLEHRFTPGFRVDLHHKDLEIALSSAGLVNVPMPLAALSQQLLRQLRAAGRGGEDHSAILAAVEAQAGLRKG